MLPQDQIDMLLQVSKPVLDKVFPVLAARTTMLIKALAVADLSFGAHMGLRTLEQQAALYAQGRLDLATVNLLRKQANMGPLSAADNQNRVTNLKVGFHNFGLAVDIVEDGDPNQAGIQWSWKQNMDYLKIAQFVQLAGLEWGGLWKSIKDYPHVQLTGGISLDQCSVLYHDGGLQAVWDEVTKRIQ